MSLHFLSNLLNLPKSLQTLLVAACLGLAACAPSKSNHIATENSSGIINGEVVDSKSELAKSIVGLFDVARGSICTGSLLPDNVVLTAGHCVGAQIDKMVVIFDADMMGLLQSNDRERITKLVRRVTASRVHPNWDRVKASKKPDTWDDIALLKFAGSVPEGFKPAELLSNVRELEPNVKVVLAGYGVNNVEITPVDPKSVPDLPGSEPRDQVYCDAGRTKCVSLKTSGSGLLRTTEVSVSKILPYEVVVNQRQGTGACSGDSGGPAYIQKNGKYFLWGVTSRGTPGCNLDGVYTNALTYADWMADKGSDGF